MAIQIPVITEFIDQGLKDAKSAFGNFKASVKDAEGAMGKFKAGTKSALDIVKANAGSFALGAGAAFAGFAAKGIQAFQDVALKAGEFASQTGIVVDDASRWREVFGDMGVNTDAAATAIGKMNREIASNPKLVRDLGDDIRYAKDGSLDANETFLHLIDRLKGIKDPAERAKEGARIFGKGWQDMSLLVEAGSGKLRESLAAVSDQKVITKDELDKARRFRDGLNDLKDAGEDLAISLGENLLPVVSDIVTGLNDFVGFFKQGWHGTEDFVVAATQPFEQIAEDIGLADRDFETFLQGIKDGSLEYHDAFHNNIISSIDDTTTALEDLQTQWDDLTSDIEGDIALRNMEIELGNVKDAAAKAFGGTQEDLLNYRNEIDQARLKLIELGQGLDLQDQRTLKIYVDKSDLEGAVGYLKAIGALGTGFGGEKVNQFGRIVAGARAGGGPVMAGGSYLVGENGPEIFTPGSSGSITPNGAIGGGNVININMPVGSNGDDVVKAITRYARFNGNVPVATTTVVRR